jgi:hypothetical protein
MRFAAAVTVRNVAYWPLADDPILVAHVGF